MVNLIVMLLWCLTSVLAGQASSGTVLMMTLPGPQSALYNYKALAEEMHARGVHVLVSPASSTSHADAWRRHSPQESLIIGPGSPYIFSFKLELNICENCSTFLLRARQGS